MDKSKALAKAAKESRGKKRAVELEQVEVPYDRRTFDMHPRNGRGALEAGDECFVHQLRLGSRFLMGGLIKSQLLDLWPGSALISRSKMATVPGKHKGDPRREVQSHSTMHIARNTKVVFLEPPPEGWHKEEYGRLSGTKDTGNEPSGEGEVHEGSEETARPRGVSVGSPNKGRTASANREGKAGKVGPQRGGVRAAQAAVRGDGHKAPPGGGEGLVGWCEAVLGKTKGMSYKEVIVELEKVAPGHGKTHKWVANVAFKMRKEGRL